MDKLMHFGSAIAVLATEIHGQENMFFSHTQAHPHSTYGVALHCAYHWLPLPCPYSAKTATLFSRWGCTPVFFQRMQLFTMLCLASLIFMEDIDDMRKCRNIENIEF